MLVKKLFLGLFVIVCISNISLFGAEKKIPLENFFRNAEYAGVKTSPDGNWIVYGSSWNHFMNLFVKDLRTNEVTQLTFSKKRSILQFDWVDDSTIIYRQDNDGDENYHIFGVAKTGGNSTDYTPFEGVKASLIKVSEAFDGTALIQMNIRNQVLFDAYSLNTKNAELKMVAENPGNVSKWVPDHEGKVRACVFTDGEYTAIGYRKTEEDPWQRIAEYNFKERIEPLVFTFDNEQLYVASNVMRDTQGIYSFDIHTGKEEKCIFSHKEVDVNPDDHLLISSSKKKKLLGIRYVEDKYTYAYLDEDFENICKFLNEKIPNHDNILYSFDKDEKKAIVFSVNEKTQGSYYLFDIEKKELTKLFDRSFWLHESEMATMTPISYVARDGLLIHGYLTLPNEKMPKNLPLIVIPHGGPWSRDVFEYNAQVQFFANRGYAVLQMNFRGSTGYGRKFLEAGYKEWGLKMQDDISDGVYWAIKNRIADPKKVVICGSSYGGYAVLCGIVKEPELYAAAIDRSGVSNLFTLFETLPPSWEIQRKQMYEKVGHPEKDKEQLLATSPIFHTDRIKTPLLVAQGAKDPKVKKVHSDQMVDALKKRNIPVEYILLQNEGHSLVNEESKMCFYMAVEAFLEKHLKMIGWKIGGKIHFEEKSLSDYIGTTDLNRITRESLKTHFQIHRDTCASNAKILIKKEQDEFILKHYEEKSIPGVAEELHATLLYTTKRIENAHQTLLDIYDNLRQVDKSLPQDQPPTVEQVATAYQKIVRPDWKFRIVAVELISGSTKDGANVCCIVAKLRFDNRDEIVNHEKKPISGSFLHLTLVLLDPSVIFETEKIHKIVLDLNEKLLGKEIQIGNRAGQADLEFGVSGSRERVRPKATAY